MRIPSHEDLDRARQVGDPLADAAVAAIGRDAWIVNAALRHARRNDEPLPDGVPAPVRDLFRDHVAPPPWFDEGRVIRAQAWAQRRVLPITVALFCSSLPTAYGAARGARVLAATGRMRGPDLDRRVHETARFVLDVVAEGGFAGAGSALRAIQKVRLAHAAVRAHLRDAWAAEGEAPINQEDMLGTLCTFSVVVIRSLRRLGAPVTDDEADDYLHLWRSVGAMIGIREDLLPHDFVSACAVSDRIAARQTRVSQLSGVVT